MSQQAQVRNPFMLLLNPEIVLAAIQNSVHLGKLNSKLCRPLDGPVAAAANADSAEDATQEEEEPATADN